MVKKKLSRDQKRKQKKQKRQQRQMTKADPFAKIIRRMKGSGLGDHKFLRNPAGLDKMSDVLMDFIEPYKEYADSEEAMHKLITTALVAWNTTLLPETKQEAGIDQISQSLPAEVVEDFKAIVAGMIERKNKYFADYTRTILDYELTDLGDSYHIAVVSTTDPNQKVLDE